MVKENRIFVFMSLTILYSMEFINYRESSTNDVLQNKKENKQSCFFFLLHISHIVCCCNVKVKDLYIGWSKEMMNTTTKLLTYCTVQCIFELSCVMLKLLKDKPAVSYPVCFFFYFKDNAFVSLLKQIRNLWYVWLSWIVCNCVPLLGERFIPKKYS